MKHKHLFSSALALLATAAMGYTEKNAWTVGASALLVQPNTTENLTYATIQEINNAFMVTSTINESISRDYDWAFDMFVRSNFVDTHRDLTLSYVHFNDYDEDNFTALSPHTLSNNFYHTAEGKIYNQIDMVDLLAGQHLDIAKALSLHLTAGVTYARVEQNLEYDYDEGLGHDTVGLWTNRALESYTKNESIFNGAGPKLGVSADYAIANTAFGFVGGLSAALLIGKLGYDSDITTATYSLTPPNSLPHTYVVNEVDNDPEFVTVTNFNANLGVRYRYVSSSIPVSAELGYRVNQFFDAAYQDENVAIAGGYLTFAVSFL